jgi:hypothetical protein
MAYSNKLASEIEEHLTTLEAIYFLVHKLGENAVRLARIRSNYKSITREERLQMRDELRREVHWVRGKVGALASNQEYRQLLAEIRAAPGYCYLEKLYIDRHLFKNYVRFFPRWSDMKLHVATILDGKTDVGTGQIYELEGPRLVDARDFLRRAEAAEKGIEDFRRRAKQDQLESLMFARASLLATFNFIEAYLNGIAYDCFMENHDKLEIKDHDLLGEWDSEKKKRRFVDFREKLFQYPVIVGKLRGRKVDMSGFQPAHTLANYAKEFRDALAHPSPFVNIKTQVRTKFFVAVGTNRRIAEETLSLAVQFAEFVEKQIGNDPKKTAPWLYATTD